MSLEQSEADQQDIFDRLTADSFFVDVPVLLEAKGVTEADIDQALATLNPKSGKNGVLAIVLMPTLAADSANAPGPRYVPRLTVQVIDQPLFNLDATTGIGKSAARVAERVRQIIHRFRSRTGAEFSFAGQEPVPVETGKNSYGLAFTRLAADNPPPKVAEVTFASAGTVAPQTVTLACITPGAAIYYTTDGTYPSPLTGTLYTAPFVQATAATIRAAAELAGYQQSNVTQATFT
jgi:hypothetical protein